MMSRFFTLVSFTFIGTLIYFWINSGQYSTVFLPVLEGAITTALFIFWLTYRRVKMSLARNRVTYLPILVSILTICTLVLVYIAFNPFGSERIVYSDGNHAPFELYAGALFQITFFPLGGIGIPLGMVISFLWPLLSILGMFNSTIFLLTVPALVFATRFKDIANLLQSQSSRKHIYVHFVFPIVILLLLFPTLSVLSSLRTLSAAVEENTWQSNHDSYETGKKIQHAIEASIYQDGEYRELFPEKLSELVERDLIESIPLSPVDNRPYTYTRDVDGRNYTLCIPQTEGERCERSWSRE